MNSFWQLLYNLLTDITATLILHLKYFNLCIYCLWIKTKQQVQGPYKLDDITFDLNFTIGIYIGKVELRSIMSSSNLNGVGSGLGIIKLLISVSLFNYTFFLEMWGRVRSKVSSSTFYCPKVWFQEHFNLDEFTFDLLSAFLMFIAICRN